LKTRSIYCEIQNQEIMKRNITLTLSIIIALLVLPGLTLSTYSQKKEISGKWTMVKEGTELDFQFRFGEESKGMVSHSLVASDFVGYQVGKNVNFSMTRPAGKLVLKGDIDTNSGKGTFNFTADNSFIKAMENSGFEEMKVYGLMLATIKNTPKSYFSDLKNLGYSDLSSSRLTAFIALDITPLYIKSIHNAGYSDLPENKMVSFKALGITSEYIDKVKKWVGDDLTENELVQFSSMGIDEEYANKMSKSGIEISPKQISRPSI